MGGMERLWQAQSSKYPHSDRGETAEVRGTIAEVDHTAGRLNGASCLRRAEGPEGPRLIQL